MLCSPPTQNWPVPTSRTDTGPCAWTPTDGTDATWHTAAEGNGPPEPDHRRRRTRTGPAVPVEVTVEVSSGQQAGERPDRRDGADRGHHDRAGHRCALEVLALRPLRRSDDGQHVADQQRGTDGQHDPDEQIRTAEEPGSFSERHSCHTK